MISQPAGLPSDRINTIRGSLEILAAFALAGSSIPLGRKLVGELPLFLTAFLSLGAAMAVLLPVLWFRRKELVHVDGKNALLIVLQALSGMVLFRILLFAGLRFTGALSAAVITSLTPFIMALAGFLVLRETIRPRLVLSLLLATAGIIVLKLLPIAAQGRVLFESGGFSRFSLLGDFLVLAAVCGEVGMTLLRKKASPAIGSQTNSALIVITAFLCTLPLAVIETAVTGYLPRLTLTQMAGLGYYGAGATALAYILWGSGCRRIPGSLAGLFMAAMPLTAAVLSIFLLGEKPNAGILGGGILVLAALVLGSLP